MSVNIGSWEHQLMDLAYEGIHSSSTVTCSETEAEYLQNAYTAAKHLTQDHSQTFFLASGLLPPEKRQAVRALYAFCRTTDDIVDLADPGDPSGALTELMSWRDLSMEGCEPEEGNQVLAAWTDTQVAYGIPRIYSEQLIDGVARDLTQRRYATFAELTAYCYGVASTVGLMAMYIIGFSGPEAVPYAVKLGVALQLTNILRDVAEDWGNQRLYLPQDELERFGITEQDIDAGEVNNRWRDFMRFQIRRNRRLYAESLPGVQMLHRDGRFAIGAAAELYRSILDDIEAHDMDVFHRRAHVSTTGKLRRLPGIWWRSSLGGYQA